MTTYSGPRRTWIILYIFFAILIITLFITSLPESSRTFRYGSNGRYSSVQSQDVDNPLLIGKAIAPKLGNETAKAELGRAAWKLFHTTFARFPDKPTEEESTALKSYIHLFQRLYPCGECASHFGVILEKFPPQVSSRSAAAAWGCHVHNQVNKSLKKELFDCSQIGDFYDCGCADEEGSEKAANKDEWNVSKGRSKDDQHHTKNEGSVLLELKVEE